MRLELDSSSSASTTSMKTSGKSRFEINFCRLMRVCEEQTARRLKVVNAVDSDGDGRENGDVFPAWRLDKFLETLEGQLREMRKGAQVDAEVLQDYEKRVKYLRSVSPPSADAFASSSSAPHDDDFDASLNLTAASASSSSSSKSLAAAGAQTPPDGGAVVLSSGHFAPRGVHRAPDGPTGRRIEETLRSSLEERARRELMGEPEPAASGSVLRNRAGVGLASDVDAILAAHQEEQDRVAEQMLHLARGLKEQSLAAGRIIAKDRDTLETANRQAETNFNQLQKETQILSGYRANACKCWIYVLMFCVCLTFIGMVLFMRLFKKRA